MFTTNPDLHRRVEMLIDELLADEELCHAFISSPARTLSAASDWGLPFCDSEVVQLRPLTQRLWERVVEEMETRRLAA